MFSSTSAPDISALFAAKGFQEDAAVGPAGEACAEQGVVDAQAAFFVGAKDES